MNEKWGFLSIFELEQQIVRSFIHLFIHSFDGLKMFAKFCRVTDQPGILLIRGNTASAYLPSYVLRSMLELPHPGQYLLHEGEPREGWGQFSPASYYRQHRSTRASVTVSALPRPSTVISPVPRPPNRTPSQSHNHHSPL